jgi:DNA-binding NarL/FixJ family response regulator
MSRLRVLVADDDPMVREALREVLDAQPDLEVVGVAKDTDETIELAGLHTPAVLVLDVRMPGGGGPRAAREIGPRSPGTKILAFSAYADAGVMAEMRDIGVTDYLLKGVTNAEIVAAVRRLGAA